MHAALITRGEARPRASRGSETTGCLPARIQRWIASRRCGTWRTGERIPGRLPRQGPAAIDSTLCYVPPENSNNFSMLVHGIVQMFETGKGPYPVERTLLTTGALSFLMDSAQRGHERIETPALRVMYTAPSQSFYAHGIGS